MATRRTAFALTLLLLLACSLATVGCGSLGATGTTTMSTAPAEVSTTEVPSTVAVVPSTVPEATGGSLLGKWHNAVTGETLEFRADGTVLGTYGDKAGMTVTYATNGDQLTISVGGTLLVTDTYSVNGDTLTLTDSVTGVPGTLQRVD
jgi:hypothetical protein